MRDQNEVIVDSVKNNVIVLYRHTSSVSETRAAFRSDPKCLLCMWCAARQEFTEFGITVRIITDTNILHLLDTNNLFRLTLLKISTGTVELLAAKLSFVYIDDK